MKEKKEKTNEPIIMRGLKLENGNEVAIGKCDDSYYFHFHNKELDLKTPLLLSKEATQAIFQILWSDFFRI